MAQGAALQRTGQVGQRFRSLELLDQAARELRAHPEGRSHLPEIRGHAITALSLTDLRPLWERPLGAVINRETPQCDYQLERYAFVDFQGTGQILVRRLDDDRELLRLPHPGVKFWHSAIDFSPDGQYLLACYWLVGVPNRLLHVWHLGRHERIFAQPVRCASPPKVNQLSACVSELPASISVITNLFMQFLPSHKNESQNSKRHS